jgi:hypothetical protein
MDEHIRRAIERFDESTDGEDALADLEPFTLAEGRSLETAREVLERTDGAVCLECVSAGRRVYLGFDDGSLREVTADVEPKTPQPVDPARAAALLETADAIELVPAEATPFGNG